MPPAVLPFPSGPTAPAGRATRVRFSTRRRLVVAFGVVLAAFVAAAATQLSGLRRMEATFSEMRDHEEQMLLALRLEDVERERYAHALRFVTGEAHDLRAYEDAHAVAVDLGRSLAARVDEPDATAWLAEIRAAGEELDRTFRNGVVPASRRGDPLAPRILEQSYPRMALIDRNIDLIIARLQQSSARCRQGLADLEGRAVRFTLLLLLGAPLFIAAVVVCLSRSVTRPLARLSAGAAAIAGGDLGTRIAVGTHDEFGALAAEFNRMAAALDRHQRRLVESEKLAGVGRLAAGIAHELNNPLQVMLGYLSLHRDVSDPRLREHLAAVELETLRCHAIVDGLSDLSRPPAGAAAVALRAVCEDVTARVRAAVLPGAPRMTVDGDGLALGDPQRLGQVLFNLVKNAAEAAGPDGDVRVGIACSPGGVEVAVRDSGPGVPPCARDRLFEPFFTTKADGTGLGLAVSRAIARAHGGDIELTRGDPGDAVFTLRLRSSPEEARG